jgi:hypothetical protein
MAAQSLLGLWIEQEVIMSPLHNIVNFTKQTVNEYLGVPSSRYCRTQALPAGSKRVALLAPAGLSTTAPSGAANLSESGVTSPNTGSMPVLQLSMDFGL